MGKTVKVAIAGAQDTGKTTVSRMLSGSLSSKGVLTQYVSEFAREYIPKAGNITSLAEELFLVEQQIKKERETPEKMDLMVTDSPVFLAYIYSTLMMDLRKLDKKSIIMMGRIYDKILDHGGYDVVLLLPVKWLPADDGVRPEELRRVNGLIDLRIEAFINLHGVDAQCLTSEHSSRQDILNDYTRQAEDIIFSYLDMKKGVNDGA